MTNELPRGWDAAASQLPLATIDASFETIGSSALTRWLRGHPDSELPDELVTRMLDRDDAELTRTLARRALTPTQLDQLTRDRRISVAGAILERDDLTGEHLTNLLGCDHAELSAKVWEHPSATDAHRRAILTGTTMKARSRNPDRLVPAPSIEIPERLADHALSSHNPQVLRLAARHVTTDEQHRRYTRQVFAAARRVKQASGRHGSRLQDAHQLLQSTAQKLQRSRNPKLQTAGEILEAGERNRWLGNLDELEASLEPLLSTDTPDDASAKALLDELQAGTITPAGLAQVEILDADAYQQLPAASQALVNQRRGDLVPEAAWTELLEVAEGDPATNLGAPPHDVLLRYAEKGGRIAMPRHGSLRLLTHADTHLAAQLVAPARDLPRAADGAALATHLHETLGEHPGRWRMFATLLPEFEGTLAELLDTVTHLTSDGA